jgi:AraC family transcriptional regulator of adaptative response/methylated-DNA-[protein]-cysteine methyltransferase
VEPEAGSTQIHAMDTHTLPPHSVMLEAFLARDSSYEGVFVTAVSTTGIFCRPTCTARRPLPEHLLFFATPREAILAGYRPCLRCRPLEQTGEAPDWLQPLLAAVEADPARKWSDGEVRRQGFSPERVRRWFRRHHGMTFQAYHRARRLSSALGAMRAGDSVGRAAFEAGYDSLSGFQDAFRQQFGAAPTALDRAPLIEVTRLATPLGPILLGAAEDALVLLEFVDRRQLAAQIRRIGRRLGAVFAPGTGPLIESAAEQLGSYFGGARRRFDLPIRLVGSDFERAVWNRLLEIPYGETRSYADVARSVGRPSAVRAVGRANGMNALAIVVPCHRVVGSDGRLVGYGGGLWRKERLLELERGGPTDSRTSS